MTYERPRTCTSLSEETAATIVKVTRGGSSYFRYPVAHWPNCKRSVISQQTTTLLFYKFNVATSSRLFRVFSMSLPSQVTQPRIKWSAMCLTYIELQASLVVPHAQCLGKRSGRDSSVGIATRYGVDGPEFETRWGRAFSHSSRPVLGPTQPPIQWVPTFFCGGKAAGAWR